MPIYEYLCRRCSRRFEALVMGDSSAVCPGCQGADLEKLFSTFAVGSGASAGAGESLGGTSACGTCGDPRGPGSCGVN